MPKQLRNNTRYPGVIWVKGRAIGSNKSEKIYYITYRKDGKLIEEKAGRQFQDDMTPSRAAYIRSQRIEGNQQTNKERREFEKAKKEAERAKRWTISALWEEYKEQRPDLKGMVTDENRFQNHVKPDLGEKEPQENHSPRHRQASHHKLLKTKSPGTVRNVLELFRRIVNFGVKKHLSSPLDFKVELPKVDNERTEDLTPEQLEALIEAIEADTNIQAANLMKMILYTGLRRTELFRLEWEHIDFQRGFILIRDPKGGRDQKVPLNDAARELLEEHPRSDSPYVFPGRGGRRRTDIKHQVNRIRDAAGLPPNFRALHGLRHVFASMLASSGKVDMYTLQKLLTHKSPAMTQRYAHLRDDALQRASNVAGDLVLAAAKPKKKEKVVKMKKKVADRKGSKK